MSASDKRILMIGLPETGKSSFIQALDEVLKNPPDDTALRSDGLAHDRSYINEGKPDFIAGRQPSRTNLKTLDTSVELWFEHPPTGLKGRLQLPDKKGEIFRDQWINRKWEIEYKEALHDLAGALIFVRADAKARNDERLGVLAQQALNGRSTTPWALKEAGAQVQLVDVLQFIAEFGGTTKPLPSAVIISAWDQVGARQGDIRHRNPSTFLEREWPLLSQYLRANPEMFSSRIYGVSAFGGAPSEAGTVSPLAGKRPSERVMLREGNHDSKDITLPLRWILGLS